MDMTKPMTILLVEDNITDCDSYKNYCYTRDDVKLIGIVSSVEEALQYVKTHVPEGIILDIELNDGTGLEFLEELNNITMDFRPLIMVASNVLSESTYNYARQNGADLIFRKLKNKNYHEKVVQNLLLLRKSNCSITNANQDEYKDIETINERQNRISDKINRELDLIGIGPHLVGRKYAHDAILYVLENENKGESVFTYLAKKHERAYSTIGRAIQEAIEHAWRKSSTEDLEMHYTAAINYNTGVPTPTEFIYYYVEKIKKVV